MYETYYQLRTRPFTLSPDPEFLFLGSEHKVALSLLEYGLEPLSEEETIAYIGHRVRVAGGQKPLFSALACRRTFALTGGAPRLINQLCDHALVYGYAAQDEMITARVILDAARIMEKHGVTFFQTVSDAIELSQGDLAAEAGEVSANVPSPWGPDASLAETGPTPAAADPSLLYHEALSLTQADESSRAQAVPDAIELSQSDLAAEAGEVSANVSSPWVPDVSRQKGLYLKAIGRCEGHLRYESSPQFMKGCRMPKRFPTAKRLVMGAYLALGMFLLAHTVNAFVEDALRVPQVLPPPLSPQHNAPPASVSAQQLALDIMTKGLFAVPAVLSQEAGSSRGAGRGAGHGPPLEVAKKLLLHGTALGIGNAPMAIIQDRTNQEQKLLHLHDRVPDVGELVSIEKTRVLFQDKGQEEWLELAMLTDLEQARSMPPLPGFSQAGYGAISQPIRSPVSSVGNNLPVHIIDRGELSKALADVPHLLLQGQPTVSMTGRQFNGILLELVRIDGLYNKLGLHSGDILKRFNGMELRDPSMLLTALQQMKDERRVKLDIVRHETPLTLTYEIL